STSIFKPAPYIFICIMARTPAQMIEQAKALLLKSSRAEMADRESATEILKDLVGAIEDLHKKPEIQAGAVEQFLLKFPAAAQHNIDARTQHQLCMRVL